MVLREKSIHHSFPGLKLVSYNNDEPYKRCNNGISVMRANNCSLLGVKAFSTRQNPWLTLLIETQIGGLLSHKAQGRTIYFNSAKGT